MRNATLNKLAHDKPDIVLWRKDDQKCFIIDISVGLDVNIDKNITKKYDNYLLLSSELKRLYPNYEFEVIPIVIGATGLITRHLHEMLTKLKIEHIDKSIE